MTRPQVRPDTPPADAPREAQNGEQALDAIRAALERLRFGTIALTIHEGRVVQIDVTEKLRL